MSLSHVCAVASGLLIATAGGAAAAPLVSFSVREGDLLPGSGDRLIEVAEAPTLGEDGRLTFEARIDPAGPLSARGSILTVGADGTVVRALGGQAAGRGNKTLAGGFFSPVVGRGGHVAVGVSLRPSAEYLPGVALAAPGGVVTTVLVEGDTVGGVSWGIGESSPLVSARGDVLVGANRAPGTSNTLDSLLRRRAGASAFEVLATAGTPVPGTGRTIAGIRNGTDGKGFADDGRVLFSAEFDDGAGAVLAAEADGPGFSVLTRGGDRLPVAGGGGGGVTLRMRGATPELGVSRGGAVAFSSFIERDAGGSLERSLVVTDGVARSARPFNDAAGAGAGRALSSFGLGLAVNDRLTVAGVGSVGDRPPGSNDAVFRSLADGSWDLVAAEGDAAPGGDGVFAVATGRSGSLFSDPSLTGAGDLVFLAEVSGRGPDAAGRGTGIFFFSDTTRSLTRVLQTGDAFLGGELAGLSGFGQLNGERALNGRGDVAFTYELLSGERGVAVVAVPEPGVAAVLAAGAGLLLRRRRGGGA